MTSTQCPECKGMVAAAAGQCPHCGYPMRAAATTNPSTPAKKKMGILGGIGAVLLAGLVAIGRFADDAARLTDDAGRLAARHGDELVRGAGGNEQDILRLLGQHGGDGAPAVRGGASPSNAEIAEFLGDLSDANTAYDIYQVLETDQQVVDVNEVRKILRDRKERNQGITVEQVKAIVKRMAEAKTPVTVRYAGELRPTLGKAIQFGRVLAADGNKVLVATAAVSPGIEIGNLASDVYVHNAATGRQRKKLTPKRGLVASFGYAFALSGNLAIVSAPWDFLLPVGGRGCVYLFDVVTGKEVARIANNRLTGEDRFGAAVAMTDEHAVIGAPFDTPNVFQKPKTGAAYILDLSTRKLTKLTAGDASKNAFFGHAVAIDGDRALIGAHGANGLRGAVYVFDVRTGRQLRKLVPSESAKGQEFGFSVALSGNTAVIGTRHSRGTAYVFDVSTGRQVRALKPGQAPYFGESVAIHGDLAVVGARGQAFLFNVTTGKQLSNLRRAGAGSSYGYRVATSGNSVFVSEGSGARDKGKVHRFAIKR